MIDITIKPWVPELARELIAKGNKAACTDCAIRTGISGSGGGGSQ